MWDDNRWTTRSSVCNVVRLNGIDLTIERWTFLPWLLLLWRHYPPSHQLCLLQSGFCLFSHQGALIQSGLTVVRERTDGGRQQAFLFLHESLHFVLVLLYSWWSLPVFYPLLVRYNLREKSFHRRIEVSLQALRGLLDGNLQRVFTYLSSLLRYVRCWFH